MENVLTFYFINSYSTGERMKGSFKCRACEEEYELTSSRKDSARSRFCRNCTSHPNWISIRHIIWKHGVNFKQALELYTVSKCQCCGKDLTYGGGRGVGAHNKRQVDHCHVTGKVRGVLCWDCNVGIGKLGDNKEGVLRALNYLEKHL